MQEQLTIRMCCVLVSFWGQGGCAAASTMQAFLSCSLYRHVALLLLQLSTLPLTHPSTGYWQWWMDNRAKLNGAAARYYYLILSYSSTWILFQSIIMRNMSSLNLLLLEGQAIILVMLQILSFFYKIMSSSTLKSYLQRFSIKLSLLTTILLCLLTTWIFSILKAANHGNASYYYKHQTHIYIKF